MPISLLTNIDSLNAMENLQTNNNFQSNTIDQLSSGYRINTAGDDPAGLSLANEYRRDTAEITRGVQNANEAVSSLQIMDGGLNNISQVLDRLQTLASESASASFQGDRDTLNGEFQTLLGEIDREATTIGLNQGGQFNQALPIFVGGSTATNIVNVDLSSAAVDTQSLGLGIGGATGPQVVGNADIGPLSPNHTVAQILADPGNTTSTPSYTDFVLTGPGFSAGNQITVAVNLQGVTDINSLAASINAAIQVAANGNSPSAAAFKNANIVASVHTDASGGQELAFQSTSTPFQVEAGDVMANACMGNFASAAGTTGAALSTTVQGSVFGGAVAGPVAVQISGGSLASPVTLNLNAGDTAATLAGAVNTNSALQSVGITASDSTGSLVFTDARGEAFNVEATGDTTDALGLGTFVSDGTGAADYTSISGVYNQAAAFGNANLEFSFNGAPSVTLQNPINLGPAAGSGIPPSQLAGDLNAEFAATPGLQAAGLVASASGSTITISSSNGTYFRLNPQGSDPTADIGFGTTGQPFISNLSAAATDLPADSQGVSSVVPFSFTPMSFGGDTQTITVSANDSSGAQHTQVITLENNNLGRQGGNIDSAIAAINTQLQSDSALANIVAVKDVVGGTGQINFLSNLPSFTVSTSASPDGSGLNTDKAVSENSSPLGGSLAVAINTQLGASQALTAVTAAVQKLGTAQAAVGNGEDQLNYALGLAQSQVVNYSSAESGIRDADVAAEAANLSKAQIIQQATIAAMAQANMEPQAVLTLLKS